MKKRWSIIFMVTLFFIFGGCASNQTYEPEEINPEVDVCDVCNMSVAHQMYATQLIFKDGDIQKFDDIGCMIEMIEKDDNMSMDEIAKMYVRDVETGDWVELEDAFYVYHPEIWTPMAYGVISFATEERAQTYIDEEGYGELLNYDELREHQWGWE